MGIVVFVIILVYWEMLLGLSVVFEGITGSMGIMSIMSIVGILDYYG